MNNSPEEFLIRDAKIEDAGELTKLIHSSMLSYKHDSDIHGNVLESLGEDIDAVIHRITNNHTLVMTHNEEIVGTITISRCDNPMKYNFSDDTYELLSKYNSCSYISRFAIKDSLRKTGLGVKIMEYALQTKEATETGLVLLHTAINNKSMHEFYLNRGYILVDSEPSRGYERGLYAYEM